MFITKNIKNMWAVLKRRKFIHCCTTVSFTRYLSSSEVATALRPFYFAVHPDLFGQYPNQRVVNENSLKLLSSFLTSLNTRKPVKPVSLQFYLRKEKSEKGSFNLVKLTLRERDVRATVLTLLKACDLPTTFVDKIEPKVENERPPQTTSPFSDIKSKKVNNRSDNEWVDILFGTQRMKHDVEQKQREFRLKNWLEKNVSTAQTRSEAGKPVVEEINRLKEYLIDTIQLKSIKWDCGWNITHFRGCLEAFQSLSKQYPSTFRVLKGRTIVFAPFTGVSLEGDVLLNTGEVKSNWLDLIKNVRAYDATLLKIPSFEKTVSQVLLNIKVGRRKFMPKIMAAEYEKHLLSITTALNDYRSFQKFPKHWPKSLEDFEIVVETEAGPLMLSPTGQFIVPSSCPGFLLVNFISDNLEEARKRLNEYKSNKHIERTLHAKVKEELKLASLFKDDCITPELMIPCCSRLLEHKDELQQLNALSLHITTYYSVLTDGVVCIPWDWKL